MLSNLKIENIAIIESASISFSENFNCFTGETGAGKSIIIDSINAVLGEKTSRELVRTGADSAKVTALFLDVSQEVLQALEEYDLPCEPDNSLLIQRSLLGGGKNVCKINGEPVTVSILKAIGRLLINIHGQSDNQSLLSSEKHYQYIDNLADNAALLVAYQNSFHSLKDLKGQIKRLEEGEQQKEQRLDILNYQINELEAANISFGEISELQSQQSLAANAQKISDGLRAAHDFISGSLEFDGAGDLAAKAANELEGLLEVYPESQSAYDIIYESAINLSDTASEISGLLLEIDNDIDINEIEERLDLLYRLRKKYGDTEEEMLSFLEKAVQELDTIQSADETLLKLQKELTAQKKQTEMAAEKLSESRKKAAKTFEKRVVEQLQFLDMPNISFFVEISAAEMSETGVDRLEFLISPNLGEAAKPLSKIASGGELSRIMLAIKTVLADKDHIETLIFDEIDTGVSGRAAEKVGLKLKEVSANRQVICVTHLAQIAALADNHLFIQKEVRDDKTFTKVTSLDFAGRCAEIARITGGITNTELQLRHAEEMLINAGQKPDKKGE